MQCSPDLDEKRKRLNKFMQYIASLMGNIIYIFKKRTLNSSKKLYFNSTDFFYPQWK